MLFVLFPEKRVVVAIVCSNQNREQMKKHSLLAAAVFTAHAALAQWQPQNAGFVNDTLGFYEMSLPNDHTVWTVCYDGKLGLSSGRLVLDFTRTVNGGQTWIPGKMGTDTSLEFSNISAISETEAWVAMHKRSGTTGGGLYHTTDGGLTWNQAGLGQIFDATSFPNVVHFRDANHGVALGDPNGGYFEVYTTDDGGANWIRVTQQHMPATLANEYGFISGYYVVGSTIWFGTTIGRIWKSENYGKDWTAHVADPGGKVVHEIAFNDDKLRGVAHLRNGAVTFLYATTDGGITWTSVGQPANWKRSRITAVPGTNALVSTSVIPFDPGSAVSYDNGATWTTIDNTLQMAVSRFYNATTGYAGSFFITGPPFNPGIYKSNITFQLPASVPAVQGSDNSLGDLVKVYPTLANDVINVSLQGAAAKTASTIQLLDMAGNVVEARRSTGAGLVQINVSKLAAGHYVLRIAAGNQVVSREITISR